MIAPTGVEEAPCGGGTDFTVSTAACHPEWSAAE